MRRIDAAVMRAFFTGLALTAITLPLAAQSTPPRGPAAAPPAPAPTEMQAAPAKPYKPIAVTLPNKSSDPSLDAFRKEVAAIATRKDRAALTPRVVAKGFMWERPDAQKSDARKSGIEQLSTALGLASQDGSGWQLLADMLGEPSTAPAADHPGMLCAPAGPGFDEAQLDQLAESTQTDPMEWAYPTATGVEVRDKPAATAPVSGKLGLHLVRVMEDQDSAPGSAEWVRVVLPSGKVGFVRADALRPLSGDQICYAKEGGAWKIAGFIGGGE